MVARDGAAERTTLLPTVAPGEQQRHERSRGWWASVRGAASVLTLAALVLVGALLIASSSSPSSWGRGGSSDDAAHALALLGDGDDATTNVTAGGDDETPPVADLGVPAWVRVARRTAARVARRKAEEQAAAASSSSSSSPASVVAVASTADADALADETQIVGGGGGGGGSESGGGGDNPEVPNKAESEASEAARRAAAMRVERRAERERLRRQEDRREQQRQRQGTTSTSEEELTDRFATTGTHDGDGGKGGGGFPPPRAFGPPSLEPRMQPPPATPPPTPPPPSPPPPFSPSPSSPSLSLPPASPPVLAPPPDLFGGLLPASVIFAREEVRSAAPSPAAPVPTADEALNLTQVDAVSGDGFERPRAGFEPLVKTPEVTAEYGPVTVPPSSQQVGQQGRPESGGRVGEHLAVVSAFWEVNDARWRSTKRTKDLGYYLRGLTNLVRIAGRSRKSMVVYTAIDANTCQTLETVYTEGFAQSAQALGSEAAPVPLPQDSMPRFLCVKLPLSSLHYADWHLAEHSLVQNMPCASSMKATKLIWLNKINLVESAAHLLMLKGGAAATRMEWIDADQFAELEDGAHTVLDHVSAWSELPPWSVRESDEFQGATAAALGLSQTPQGQQGGPQGGPRGQEEPENVAVKIVAPEESAAASSPSPSRRVNAPTPGFKVIDGLVYSWDTRRQLPGEELKTWQLRAAERVAAMTAAHPVLATGGSVDPEALNMGVEGGEDATTGGAEGAGAGAAAGALSSSAAVASIRLGQGAAIAPLPLADRIQIGCYGPKQRVGPCTSNYFVASRFRASVYGIAAMRQAFEDVLFDFAKEFPGPGFKGWNVYNLSWADHLDATFDRPGFPPHGFMYAKDGFTIGKTCWSCICSTEEMIYNKMFRRNRRLFNPDRNCELTAPYEELSRGAGGAAASGDVVSTAALGSSNPRVSSAAAGAAAGAGVAAEDAGSELELVGVRGVGEAQTGPGAVRGVGVRWGADNHQRGTRQRAAVPARGEARVAAEDNAAAAAAAKSNEREISSQSNWQSKSRPTIPAGEWFRDDLKPGAFGYAEKVERVDDELV